VGAGFSVCRFDNLSRSAFVFIFTSRGLALGCHCFTPASEESDAPDQLQSLGGTTQRSRSTVPPGAPCVSRARDTNEVFHRRHDFPQKRRDNPIDSAPNPTSICLSISHSSSELMLRDAASSRCVATDLADRAQLGDNYIEHHLRRA